MSGENLEKFEVNLIPHIGLKKFNNKNLKIFKNSPFARSETSFCSSIVFQFKNTKILFLDTPGFGDSRGEEYDFSSTLGIFKALENASASKRIIPIFFFLTDELTAAGGRGNKF
jgi:hypothetical protein